MESICGIGFFDGSFSGSAITSSTTDSGWNCSANLNDSDIGAIKENGAKYICIECHTLYKGCEYQNGIVKGIDIRLLHAVWKYISME